MKKSIDMLISGNLFGKGIDNWKINTIMKLALNT